MKFLKCCFQSFIRSSWLVAFSLMSLNSLNQSIPQFIWHNTVHKYLSYMPEAKIQIIYHHFCFLMAYQPSCLFKAISTLLEK